MRAVLLTSLGANIRVIGPVLRSFPNFSNIYSSVTQLIMYLSLDADCLPVVTVIITLIGVVDDPPDTNITTTSTNPDDSEPVYCPESNSTTNTTQSVHK